MPASDRIDLSARRSAASVLRDFIEGRITNQELDERFPARSRDRAVHAVYSQTWRFQDDFREFRATGAFAPKANVLATLTRCVLFLQTDLPYEWPVPFTAPLRWVLRTLGLHQSSPGEKSVWPFFRNADLERASRQ